MHEPYKIRLKHQADFRVKYKFRDKENGGRERLPYQGIRSDFSYNDDQDYNVYMIWPEFEDKDGQIILENETPVQQEGTALMWIINPEMRIIHRNRIKVGTCGFFREGERITADCQVVEILDLFKNPTEQFRK